MYNDIKTFLSNEENYKQEISEHKSKVENFEIIITETKMKQQQD